LYDSRPAGCPGRQPRYLNAVIAIETSLSLIKLLKILKIIERSAGRRARGLNSARPLDLDIIDIAGRRIGLPHGRGRKSASYAPGASHPGRSGRRWLTLPHPHAHRRRFVLEPLAEICPHWHHPVLRVPVRRLLAGLPRPPTEIRRVLDSGWFSCDKPSDRIGVS
jgi:2-amino-4-hydroxy-6-hydroxymethyldihydropteridine diphosphokinase